MEAGAGLSAADWSSICAVKVAPRASIHRDLLPNIATIISGNRCAVCPLRSSLIAGTRFLTFSKHTDVTLKVAEIIFATAPWVRQGTRDDLGTHTLFMGCTGASPDPDAKPYWTTINLLLVNPLETQVQRQTVWSSR